MAKREIKLPCALCVALGTKNMDTKRMAYFYEKAWNHERKELKTYLIPVCHIHSSKLDCAHEAEVIETSWLRKRHQVWLRSFPVLGLGVSLVSAYSPT